MTDAATFSGIDLSRLPAPTLIEPLSYEALLAEMVARLKIFIPDFDETLESDPAVRILQVAAYFRLLDRQRVNDAARGVMVAYARGADLDQLGALFGVPRLELSPADPDEDLPAVMESDDDYRRRVVLAPESYSVAGPSGAYLFHALAADGDVLDASAVSPAPAEVVVYILSRTGTGEASSELVDLIEGRLSDESVRPVSDRVNVLSATIIPYAVVATLKTYPGPDAAVVRAEAETRVLAYVGEQKRIGRDVTRSGLIAALHAPGVQNVMLASPATDIFIDSSEAAHCTGISLTDGGVAE